MPFIPIILVTAKADTKDIVAGLEAGADEYLTKPVDQSALVARVKSMLRVKELTDKVREQAADLASWNRTLEDRVAQQFKQIERMDRSCELEPHARRPRSAAAQAHRANGPLETVSSAASG